MNAKKTATKSLQDRIVLIALILAMVLLVLPMMQIPVYAVDQVDCPNCSGTGYGWCASCEANPRKCSNCDDSGKISCTFCEDGFVVTGVCSTCNGDGKTTISGLTMNCPSCRGSGKAGFRCVHCSSGKIDCPICYGTNVCKFCPWCNRCGGTGKVNAHNHSWAATSLFDKTYHWKTCTAEGNSEECLNESKAEHSYVRSAEGTDYTCGCGAYITLAVKDGITTNSIGDCVSIKTNIPDLTLNVTHIKDLSTGKPVDEICKEQGNYQAYLKVDGIDLEGLYANFTLSNPKTTAATGDNRPIELLFFGFAAMSVLAAAAFTVDRKRR